jgi:hypothetical protein
MSQAEQDLITLFGELKESILHRGIDSTLRALKFYEEKEPEHLVMQAQWVVNAVCQVWGISRTELLYGKMRDGVRRYALEAAAHILGKDFNMKKKFIATQLNKHISNVSRYAMAVYHYNPKITADAEKIEKLKTIRHKIKLEMPVS